MALTLKNKPIFHQRKSCVLSTIVFMHRSSCKGGKKSSLNSFLSLFQGRWYLNKVACFRDLSFFLVQEYMLVKNDSL